MRQGRRIDAGLMLIDRQILDSDGRMAGKIDDLQLEVPAGGGPPFAAAILTGPGALSRRIGGAMGKWLASVHRRLHPAADPSPPGLPFGIVKRIDNHVELTLPKADLPNTMFENWVRDRIIAKIPGAAHEAE